MKNKLGKWKQHLLLSQNPLIAKSIPETTIYSVTNLLDFISRFDYVYVKHDSSGQGRAIFKVYEEEGTYCFDGYNIQGEPIIKCVTAIEDFHKVLHPFEKFGRLGNYIIQEGIQSFTPNGMPMCIRVHVQLLKGKWVIGGINAKVGTSENNGNGILNYHRGSVVITIDELLSLHWPMNEREKEEIVNCLKEVSISVSKEIASQFPSREYGIDFGINAKGKPILYEVNSTPGINGFAKIADKSIWKRIVEIRKLQNEE